MTKLNLDNTFGMFFDAAVIGSALYGAACMQAWYYYHKYKSRDDWKIKTLVASVMFLDTCHVVTVSAAVYTYLVTHHNDPTVIGTLPQTLIIQVVFSNLIAVIVQMFYVFKIYILCDRKWYRWPLTAPVAGVALVQFIAMNVFFGKIVHLHTFSELAQFNSFSIAVTVLGAVVDSSISLVIVFLLRGWKGGLGKTDDMINRTMLFTFNTGIPTSACAVMSLICVGAFPNTPIYIFFFLILSRFYTNSLLALINSRDYIRAGGLDHENYAVSLETQPKSHGGQVNNTQIAIQMDTVKESDASDCYVEAGIKANSIA